MKLLFNKNLLTINNAKAIKNFRNNLKNITHVKYDTNSFTEDHVVNGSKGTLTIRTYKEEAKDYVDDIIAFFTILSATGNFEYDGKMVEFYRNYGDYYGSNAIVTVDKTMYEFKDIRYTMNTLHDVLLNSEGRDRGVR